MSAIILPEPDEIAVLLRDLVGKAMTSKKCAAAPPIRGAWMVASYATNDGEIAGVVAVDMTLAAHVSAALALIPGGVADESARSGKLAENLKENLHEVLNICSRFFNSEGLPRVVLAELKPLPAPPKAAAIIAKPKSSLHVDVTIAGYKGGKMSFFAT
jgi:hypothetical protein